MIIGLGGGGLGITRPQSETLRRILPRMDVHVAIHRGMTGMESMLHNVIRSVYPLIPIHVLPIVGIYSSIASQPLPQFPQTILYQPDTADTVNTAIVNSVWGIVFCPENMTDSGPGWDLVSAAREFGVPVAIVWPDGRVTQ